MGLIAIETLDAIHKAVAENNINRLTYLIEMGFPVNIRDSQGKTPLHIATEQPCFSSDIIYLLLIHGAEPNAKSESGKTPLHFCVAMGHYEIAKILITWQADPNLQDTFGLTPLLYAIQKGDLNLVKFFLKNGSDPNQRNNQGITPIIFALQHGNLKAMKFLIQNGVDLKSKFNNPIFFKILAKKKQLRIYQTLLKSGFDINTQDTYSATLLHYASASNTAFLTFLLNSGADLNKKDFRNKTPLYYALENGIESNVKMLIRRGADINFSEELVYDLKRMVDVDENVENCLEVLLKHLIQEKLLNLLEEEVFLPWKNTCIDDSLILRKFELTCRKELEKMQKKLICRNNEVTYAHILTENLAKVVDYLKIDSVKQNLNTVYVGRNFPNFKAHFQRKLEKVRNLCQEEEKWSILSNFL